MKNIARWMAIAMAIALVFGCALAETATPVEAAPEIDAEALYEEGMDAYDAEDYATALEKFTPAAEAGYAPAQRYLAGMYRNGLGVEQDVEKAVDLLKKAAEQDDAAAATTLGMMYTLGEGVEQDYEEALKWAKQAALLETMKDPNSLGAVITRGTVMNMYAQGMGTEPDMEAAQEWYDSVMKASPDYDDPNDPLAEFTNKEAIELAQSRLNQVGYDCGRDDGVFDEATGAMLTRFQQDRGLTVTGTVTRETALLLYDVAYTETDKGEIQSAQGMLNGLGYDCGTPDGIAGKKTADAVTRFQQDNGLTVTGTLNHETLDKLKEEAGAN